MGKLFGTDGIRGLANIDLTPELAFKVGRAGAYKLGQGKKGKILIGRDTRASGPMLEAALVAGITSMGIDVVSLGIIPTPALALLSPRMEALAAIVISASHNPGEDNGIKFFNQDGFKLSDEEEEEIEELIKNIDSIDHRPVGGHIGRLYREERAGEIYKEFLKETIKIDLSGIKVVMDCGHGALYKIGPEIIRELNGQVFLVNASPDGMNINDKCGSTNPQIIQDLVLEKKAHIGLSFDGDGDRIIAVDDKGRIVDGDHILAIYGSYLKEKGALAQDTIVGTVMTNMGLDIYLKENGMKIVKTDVGDRYVLEEMIKSGYVLGGEQSGHIIFLDHNTTGDGLATGLHLLEVMLDSGRKLSDLNSLMTSYPQVLENARVRREEKYSYLDNKEIKEEIERIESLFAGQGRILIRPSGTESLVRVMIEGKDEKEISKLAKGLKTFIEERLG